MAVNCWVSPLGTVGLAGVTAIDSRTAALAVSVAEPVMPSSVGADRGGAARRDRGGQAAGGDGGDRGRGRCPGHPLVALIEEVPLAATAVARPPAVMVATEVVADAQVTVLVRFSVELSE